MTQVRLTEQKVKAPLPIRKEIHITGKSLEVKIVTKWQKTALKLVCFSGSSFRIYKVKTEKHRAYPLLELKITQHWLGKEPKRIKLQKIWRQITGWIWWTAHSLHEHTFSSSTHGTSIEMNRNRRAKVGRRCWKCRRRMSDRSESQSWEGLHWGVMKRGWGRLEVRWFTNFVSPHFVDIKGRSDP